MALFIVKFLVEVMQCNSLQMSAEGIKRISIVDPKKKHSFDVNPEKEFIC